MDVKGRKLCRGRKLVFNFEIRLSIEIPAHNSTIVSPVLINCTFTSRRLYYAFVIAVTTADATFNPPTIPSGRTNQPNTKNFQFSTYKTKSQLITKLKCNSPDNQLIIIVSQFSKRRRRRRGNSSIGK